MIFKSKSRLFLLIFLKLLIKINRRNAIQIRNIDFRKKYNPHLH